MDDMRRKREEALQLDNQLAELLEQTSRNMNTVPFSEFKEYEPLYRKSSLDVSGMDQAQAKQHLDEMQDLSARWFRRISPYREIRIVEDTNKDNVIKTLPACLTTVPDTTDGDNAKNMSIAWSALMNNIERDGTTLEDRVTPLAKLVAAELARTTDDTRANEHARQIAEANERLHTTDSEVTKVGTVLNSVQWED